MPLPQRRWFRIADVARRWNMPLSDIEDYALGEMLQLSVFVVDVRVGTNGSGGGVDRSIQGMPLLNGPQPLQRTGLLEIFREGQAEAARRPAASMTSSPSSLRNSPSCGAADRRQAPTDGTGERA